MRRIEHDGSLDLVRLHNLEGRTEFASEAPFIIAHAPGRPTSPRSAMIDVKTLGRKSWMARRRSPSLDFYSNPASVAESTGKFNDRAGRIDRANSARRRRQRYAPLPRQGAPKRRLQRRLVRQRPLSLQPAARR